MTSEINVDVIREPVALLHLLKPPIMPVLRDPEFIISVADAIPARIRRVGDDDPSAKGEAVAADLDDVAVEREAAGAAARMLRTGEMDAAAAFADPDATAIIPAVPLQRDARIAAKA